MQYWNSLIFKSETSNIATLIPTTLISGASPRWNCFGNKVLLVLLLCDDSQLHSTFTSVQYAAK